MNFLIFLICIPINLLLIVISTIIVPILPALATQQEGWLNNCVSWGVGPRLPKWLNWFMTPDNSLDGDSPFIEINGISYLSKIKWLIRNPAYGFAVRYIQAPYNIKVYGDTTIQDNKNAKEGWCLVTANGLFTFKYVKRIFKTNRCIYITMGWGVLGLVASEPKPKNWMALFLFSPRISGFY